MSRADEAIHVLMEVTSLLWEAERTLAACRRDDDVNADEVQQVLDRIRELTGDDDGE